MSSVVEEVPRLEKDGTRLELPSPIPALAGLALCLILAVAQVAWAGYQLGVGNQAIQIAFLKHWANPALFANDDMVRQTLPLYPSYFFRMLAPLLHVAALDPLYFSLHVLTTFFTLAMVYTLGRSIFRSHASALAAVAILVAGHHRALAGDTLYSTGFTHTYVALPLALAALALAYRRRMGWAFVVAGVLFNLHALTGAYVLLMLGAALLADCRSVPFSLWLRRAVRCGIAAVAIAAPTLVQMAGQHQTFDATWINLMRIRSAEHSFPSTWWAAGNPDLPRFALLLALFVMSWSFGAVRQAGSGRALALNMTRWMTAAVLALFAVGYVFTELVPTPLIIRLQPFRASRLLLVLLFVHIAHAAVIAIRAGWTGETAGAAGERVVLRRIPRIAEIVGGVLVLATLTIPPLLPLLPLTVAVVTIVALVSGRLSWGQAIVVAGSLVIAIQAYRPIQFPLPFVSAERHWFSAAGAPGPGASLAIGALLTALFFAVLIATAGVKVLRNIFIASALICGAMLTGLLLRQHAEAPPTGLAATVGPAAEWARTKTPLDTIFLTPSGYSTFRLIADRAVVADWRDGTQLYFSGKFGPDWFDRMTDIEPGLTLSPDNSRLLARGQSLDTLDTDALVALAAKYHATYILLPAHPSGAAGEHLRPLQVAFSDPHFTVYSLKPPAIAATGPDAIPKGVIHPADWLAARKFMETTVAENIEKYRKSDLKVQIVDPTGRPVQDLVATVDQTRHAFNFGVSLGFFEPNDIRPQGDEKGAPVTPQELALMPTCFNASMIPFSGKWMYTEPAKDQVNFSDLDKYIGFCADHDITVEYHFLTGLAPAWLRGNQAEALKRLPAHAMGLVDRYHNQVKYWQLTNEQNLVRGVPEIYKSIRAKYPDLKLGIADCVKFYSGDDNPIGKRMDMYRGVQMIPWLKSQGVQLDYFGIHGHRPYGLWADPRTMYDVFDTIAKMGVKLHVTEMLLPLGDQIVGPMRRGIWTPALQADFLQDYLTVCFSHPAMELVNFWGLAHDGWGESAGLLDDQLKPRPAFDRIKHLVNDVWHTRVSVPLPLDGTIATRAFHGDYALTVALRDGRVAKATFAVPEGAGTNVRYCLDTKKGTLVRVDAGALRAP
jgi:GH35 family endo-1,4-beta-xylanase